MCGGGGAPPPPPLDPAAVALEQKQLELLTEQQQMQEAFAPLQAEQYGYVQKTRDVPNVVPFTAQEKATNQAHLNDVNQAINNLKSGNQDSFTNWGGKVYTKDNVGDLENWRDSYFVPTLINATSENRGTKSETYYEKTAERVDQDKQIKDLQSAQMATAQKANDALNKYLDSLDTEDYKAYQKAQQDLQAQQTQIALAQGERQKKALAGELPVSQGTIDRKAADFQLLKENLARGGNAIIGDDPGSAYSLSSPGVQALKEFNSRYGAIEDQERQGTLDSSASTYLQSVGLSGNLGQSALNTTGQLSNPGGYASTSTSLTPGASPVQNNLSLVQGYSSAMNPYLQQQQMQWQTGQNNAQIAAQNQAGWLQLGGTALGTGAGFAALALSNRKFKKNIEPIKSEKDATVSLSKTPVYRWNYKNEPEGHKKHLGTMTDEAPEDVVTDDGNFLDIASYMGLLTLSAKDLHNRVLSLEGRAA